MARCAVRAAYQRRNVGREFYVSCRSFRPLYGRGHRGAMSLPTRPSENFLASRRVLPQHRGAFSGGRVPPCMKAKIIVTPKKAVLDPQGKTVQNALEHMGYRGVKAVHVGKYLEIELDGSDKETARQQLNEAAHKFLSNPVIEDYRLEIE
jgi:phosphoribosylformylglycinamidine synthase